MPIVFYKAKELSKKDLFPVSFSLCFILSCFLPFFCVMVSKKARGAKEKIKRGRFHGTFFEIS
jgi:hypothetical protein